MDIGGISFDQVTDSRLITWTWRLQACFFRSIAVVHTSILHSFFGRQIGWSLGSTPQKALCGVIPAPLCPVLGAILGEIVVKS